MVRLVEFIRARSPVRTPAPWVSTMFRFLSAATVAAIVASVATAQTAAPVVTPAPPPGTAYPPGTVIQYPGSTVIEYPDKTVFTSPVYQRPAIGLGAASSPFYFASEWGIGGPGYAYRGYPPFNGWSSGYRGAYYGSPVPAYSYSYPRRWR